MIAMMQFPLPISFINVEIRSPLRHPVFVADDEDVFLLLQFGTKVIHNLFATAAFSIF